MRRNEATTLGGSGHFQTKQTKRSTHPAYISFPVSVYRGSLFRCSVFLLFGVRQRHAVRGVDLEALQPREGDRGLRLRVELHEGDPGLGLHHAHLLEPGELLEEHREHRCRRRLCFTSRGVKGEVDVAIDVARRLMFGRCFVAIGG